MTDSKPDSTVEQNTGDDARLAPHPILTEYYPDEPERRKEVNRLFNVSAGHYDWITDVLSFGSGRWYRRDVLQRHGLNAGMSHLDVGSGTGVIAALGQEMVGETGRVCAVDPSVGMLTEAKKAGVRNAFLGMGESLPFADDSFDLLTMGYALRHVNDLRQTFEEYRRAVKPGGQVLILEISRPASRFQYYMLKVYLKYFVPVVTRLFRRSKDAQVLMSYYWDTIDKCVPPDTIVKALQDAGLQDVKRNVVMGIFSEYVGVKGDS